MFMYEFGCDDRLVTSLHLKLSWGTKWVQAYPACLGYMIFASRIRIDEAEMHLTLKPKVMARL